MRLPSFVATLAVLTTLLASAGVRADADDLGFAADRFDPAERGSDWFALDSLDLRGDARIAAGLTTSYARKPLVLRDPAGERALLDSQLFVHAAASLVIAQRVRLGLDVPFAPFVAGTGSERFAVEEGAAMGDIRLSSDVRLVGTYGSPFTAAVGAALWFPSGNYAAYTGDAKVRVGPRVAIAGIVGRLHYAARLAFDYRGRDGQFGGIQLGSTLGYGAALGVRAGKSILIGPELFGTSVVKGGVQSASTAVEAVLGVHYIGDAFRVGVGAGPGLTDGLGSPELRGLLSFEWTSRNGIKRAPVDTRSDRDGDKVPDFTDACPDKPGSPESDPPGCDLSDGDGDGVQDRLDACPFAAGPSRADATVSGCPTQDRDNDGVQDSVDACADKAGRATADARTHGCADTDGDSVFDPVDACPLDAGVANLDPAKSGCPVLGQPEAPPPPPPPAPSSSSTSSDGANIAETVQFVEGTSDIAAAGTDVLERVRATLLEHPEITLVSVEGHTDAEERKGRAQMRLSKKRVADVLAWLSRAGISSERMIGHGFGAERPVAPNLTDEGRAQNRRVELHVLEVNHRPVGKE